MHLATNRRTYIFAGEYVYQIYRDGYGLQQKSAFLITDMFPGGPRTVDAAVTNMRKGVTILIQSRRVYRYRWKRDQGRKRFEVHILSFDSTYPTPCVEYEFIIANPQLAKELEPHDRLPTDAGFPVVHRPPVPCRGRQLSILQS